MLGLLEVMVSSIAVPAIHNLTISTLCVKPNGGNGLWTREWVGMWVGFYECGAD